MSNVVFPSLGLLLALLLLVAPAHGADPSSGQAAQNAAGERTGAASTTSEAGGSDDPEVRDMTGTSIIGNRELPKSLYIVPWKNSEVGLRTDLSRDLLDEGLNPVDPNEFERQVDYYHYHQQRQ